MAGIADHNHVHATTLELEPRIRLKRGRPMRERHIELHQARAVGAVSTKISGVQQRSRPHSVGAKSRMGRASTDTHGMDGDTAAFFSS